MNSQSSKSGNLIAESNLPICNIHIHLPSINTSVSRNFLPPIQPIIHLHFDKQTRNSGDKKDEKSKEVLLKTSVNLQSLISPKSKNAKFQHKNKTGEENAKKSDENNETPCSKKSHSNDSQLREEKPLPDDSENNRMGYNLRNNQNRNSMKKHGINSNSMLLSKYEDLKLRKAVVVLTDICKQKMRKNPETDTSKSPSRINSQEENNEGKDAEDEICSIKEENESYTSVVEKVNESLVSDSVLENNCDQVKPEETVVSTSTTPVSPIKKRLTALAEGCNFSEILSRLRRNCDEYFLNTIKSPTNSELGDKHTNDRDSDYFNETIEENDRTDCEFHDGNREVDLNFNESHDLYESESVKVKHSSSPPEIDDSLTVKTKEYCPLNESNEDMILVNEKYIANDSNSDKFTVTSGKCLSSGEVIVDSKTITNESFIKIKSSGGEDNFRVSETKYSRSIDVGDVNFHLHLIKKEMQRRSQISSADSKKNKSPKSRKKSDADTVKSDNSSPPKKMKHTVKKELNVSATEDYIPLNASGPTKFAVAPLDSISPYKTHSAKTFKQEMLFGNRVARFSTSDQLRMYQLKQQAARSSVHK